MEQPQFLEDLIDRRKPPGSDPAQLEEPAGYPGRHQHAGDAAGAAGPQSAGRTATRQLQRALPAGRAGHRSNTEISPRCSSDMTADNSCRRFNLSDSLADEHPPANVQSRRGSS